MDRLIHIGSWVILVLSVLVALGVWSKSDMTRLGGFLAAIAVLYLLFS